MKPLSFPWKTPSLISLMILVQFLLLFGHQAYQTEALNVVLAGGTGTLGPAVISRLSSAHDITVLTRNAFLASAPAKVTSTFGYLGKSFLQKHRNVKLRDWDGGDLLEIVGQDWVGWQEDALAKADVVVHLFGGYTNQREMATERVVRESLQFNPSALQVAVNPAADDITIITPGMVTAKTKRVNDCEEMVKANCVNHVCLRLEAYKTEENVQAICDAIESCQK